MPEVTQLVTDSQNSNSGSVASEFIFSTTCCTAFQLHLLPMLTKPCEEGRIITILQLGKIWTNTLNVTNKVSD